MIKKIAVSMLLGCIFIAFSCSKSNTPAPALSVLGTWGSTSRSYTGCIPATSNGTETCVGDCPWTLIFTEVTFENVNIPGFYGSGTYTTTSSTLTLTAASGSSETIYNLSVTSTTMTLTTNPDPTSCVITMSFTKL